MQKFDLESPIARSKTLRSVSQGEDATSYISRIQPTDQNTQATKPSKHLHETPWKKAFHPFTERKLRFKLDKLFTKGFTFPIEEELISPATRVMFNDSNHMMQQICLKMWLECNNGVYNTGNLVRRTKYLIKGLLFNRRFAPGIYLGIAPIIVDNQKEKTIQCGPLIQAPENLQMDFNKPYALVMKRLDERWRLDHQLNPDRLGNEQGMEFLAHEIASMHRQFVESPLRMGTPKSLVAKLQFNCKRFQEALDRVEKYSAHSNFKECRNEGGMYWFRTVGWLLEQVAKIQQSNFESFEQRHDKKHIRRCHGDLKATNLWVCQANNSRFQSRASKQNLIALDCVDFKPEFCHIDTLSDVAMLAIDLEMRLTSWSDDPQNQVRGKELSQLFLNIYLHEMGEKESARLLLEYYLIEKAMVCMYMSVLYDDLPSLGEKYLNVVLTHSQNLATYLPQKIARMITKPLHLISN